MRPGWLELARSRSHRPLAALRLPGPTAGLAIGVMGGSFDPAHHGHVHVRDVAMRRLGLDWMWVAPARGNPLKHTATPFPDRLAAARNVLGGPRTRVTDIERELELSYTIDLLRALKRRAPAARFVWVMGADNLASFHLWKRWRDIARLAPIAVVSRPGAFPKAGLSRFALQFGAQRLPTSAATSLAHRRPPAWVLLPARFDAASSTALRALRAATPPLSP